MQSVSNNEKIEKSILMNAALIKKWMQFEWFTHRHAFLYKFFFLDLLLLSTYSYLKSIRKMITTLDSNALENYCRAKHLFKEKIIDSILTH